MILTTEIAEFIENTRKSISNNTFVKLTLSKMVGVEKELKNIFVRMIYLKGSDHLSFTRRYPTRDEVKNYKIEEGLNLLQLSLGTDFLNANLFTTEADFTLTFNKKRKARLFKKKASTSNQPTKSHDKNKNRTISPVDNIYFQKLGITNREGSVLKSGFRKFKQINKYIEILSGFIEDNFDKKRLNIIDVGSGKGYLTFALYDYLKNILQKEPQIAGIELRESLVNFTNDLAQTCGFNQLQFVAQDINEFEVSKLDILIALHACDIATDIAIAKGIQSNAKLIVVAPCCHKQIRREMQCKSELAPILKHGIMEERQAELVTDGIRALLLEAHGYKTKVFEFISTEHTAKNLMIVGTLSTKKTPDALKQIDEIKQTFGIKEHYLEKLLLNK